MGIFFRATNSRKNHMGPLQINETMVYNISIGHLMNYIMNQEPITLGEKLASVETQSARARFHAFLQKVVRFLIFVILLIIVCGLYLWAFTQGMNSLGYIVAVIVVMAAGIMTYKAYRDRNAKLHKANQDHHTHFLIRNDRHSFMQDLHLDAKTAILDGSNIYHFGRANELDAQVLGMVVDQLRREGFRIVCFFDANIFYTLSDHGAFPSDQRHSVSMLDDIFGLKRKEIYVMPSRIQADKYILETMIHLKNSFAVSNDQFRDYAKHYATIMKGNQWRKSVMISKNEIKLAQHRFKTPLRLN
jgi:uncharacterized membrane protein